MRTFLAFLLALALPVLAHAGWTTDYKTALARARAENKNVLLDFTGTDWCASCKLLDQEVFEQPSFKDFLAKNYIAVTLDYPEVTPQPDALKEQNEAVAEQFNVDTFPTLIVLSPEGKVLGRETGYVPGTGPEAVIAKLKSFK